MKNTKQCVIIIAAVLAAVLFCSCQSDDMEEVGKPTFKITSFSKEAIEGGYCCKATIQITALTGDYSIDGLIYADNIRGRPRKLYCRLAPVVWIYRRLPSFNVKFKEIKMLWKRKVYM